MAGIEIFEEITPIKEAFIIIGNIAIMLAGAFPLVHFLTKILNKPLMTAGKKMEINEISAAGFLVSLPNNIPMLGMVKDMDEKRQVFIMRCLIVVFIAISVVMAILQYKSSVTFIAQLMGVSWGALAGAFLAPFLYGLYWKKTSSAGCWASFIFSTVVMLANVVVKPMFPAILQSPINAGAFCMIAGLIIVPVVSAFTKKPDGKHLEDVFSCYDAPVTVTAKHSLNRH